MSNDSSSPKSTKSTQPSTKKLKKSHYRDLFNTYFFTIFKRRLTYLYLPFVKDDVYILANVAPYDLLADKHDAAFGYVNLKDADPVFRDLVRNWILTAFPGKDVCIRLDYFTQICNRYFGDKIIPGQELLPVKKVMPAGHYPDLVVTFNEEHEYTQYLYSKTGKDEDLVTVAWDTSQGYSILPIYKALKDFDKYQSDENIDNFPLTAEFPKGAEEIRRGNQVFRFKPVIGYDALDTSKVKIDVSALTVLGVSTRAVQYGHYLKSKGVVAMITRPNNVLFPQTYVKTGEKHGGEI